jgi:hypothetical protein
MIVEANLFSKSFEFYYLHSGYWFAYTFLKVKFYVYLKYVYLKNAKSVSSQIAGPL